MVDTFLILKCALAGFLAGGTVLLVMSLSVSDPASDFAREKKLLDPLGPSGIPIHYRFFHPATTDHWRRLGLLKLLTAARVVFAVSFIVGLGTLIWLGWR